HAIRVGVSIDGPRHLTEGRVLRNRRPAYDRIVRGLDALRRHELPFAALCVVTDPSPARARDLYGYALELGCTVLGVNVEEQEGVNTRSNAYAGDEVRGFWATLTEAWRADPRVEVREVEWALRFAGASVAGEADAL